MDNQGGWAPRPGPMVLNAGATPQQRPASAGTRLRQKPSGTAPPHQDIFASLGLDASRNRVNYGPSQPTGNATGMNTASAAPPTASTTLFQYTPRQATTMSSRLTNTTTTTTTSNRFMTPANRVMANTSTATSTMGFGYNRPPSTTTAPPVAPLVAPSQTPSAAPPMALPVASPMAPSMAPPMAPPMADPVAPSLAPPIVPPVAPPMAAPVAPPIAPPSAPQPASVSTLSRPKPTQFFAMEDDTFDGDDGWGCDSPSTVFSNPMDDADESAVIAEDDEFAWVDEEPIKSSKPVEEPGSSMSNVVQPPVAAPSSSVFGETSAAPPSPATSAFGVSSAPSTSSFAPLPTSSFASPPSAALSAFGHSFHSSSYQTQEHRPSQKEQDEWSDNWSDKPAAPSAATPITSAVHESSSALAEQHSSVASFVTETATASSNDFWGAQDDDALFDQPDEQWGESVAVEDSLEKLSLEEQPADPHVGAPSLALNTSFSQEFQPEVASSASSEHNTSFGSSSLSTSAVFTSASVSSFTSNAETVEQVQEATTDAPMVTKDRPVEHSQSSFKGKQTPAEAVFASISRGSLFEQPSVEKEFESSHLHDSYRSESHSNIQNSAHDHSGKEIELKWDDQSGTEDAAWGNVQETDNFASTSVDQPVKQHTKHSKEYSPNEPDSQHLFGGESTEGSYFNSPDGGNGADDTFSFEHSASFANTRHAGGSVVSFGGVSSAGATFGGSEHASDDLYSDGNASETRSLFGSSNASTAFGTDFPSVSEGQFSVAGTVFEGSDASDDAPFSDGNGSEARSMFGSSTASTAFAQAGSVGNDTALDEPSAFGSSSSTRSELDSDVPAASSIFGVSDSVDASQFGAPRSSDQQEDIPAAASLFGTTSGSDVPNPFSSFGAPPSSGPSGFPEHNLPTANAADLFGSAPSGGDFNGSFEQSAQQYGESSYNSYQQDYAEPPTTDFGNQTANGGEYDAHAQFGHSEVAYDTSGSVNYHQEPHANQAFDDSATSAESMFGGHSLTKASYGQESSGMSGYGSASDMFANSQASPEPGYGSYDQNGYNGVEGYNGQQSDAQRASAASAFGEQQSASFEQHHDATQFSQQDESARFYAAQPSTADNFFGGATTHQYIQSNTQSGFDSRVNEQQQQHQQSNSSLGYFGQSSYQNNAHAQQHQESHFLDGVGQSYESYDQSNAQANASSQVSATESAHSSGGFDTPPVGNSDFNQRSLAPPSLSRGVSNASSYAEQHFQGSSEGDHYQSRSPTFSTVGHTGSTLATQRKSLGNASAASMDARDETPLRKRSSSFSNSSHLGADSGELTSSGQDYNQSYPVPPSPANSSFGQVLPVQGDSLAFGQSPAHGSVFGNPPNTHPEYASHSTTESHQHAQFPAHPPSVGGRSDDSRSYDGDRMTHHEAVHHFQPSQASVGGSEYSGFQNDFGRSSMDSHDPNALPVQEVDSSSYFGGSNSSSGFDGFNQAQPTASPSDFFAASGPPQQDVQNQLYGMQQQQQQYPAASLASASHPQPYATQTQQQHQHAPSYQQSHGSYSRHDSYGAGTGMQRSLSSASMSSHHSESYYAHQAPAAPSAHQYQHQQHHAQAPMAHAGYQQNTAYHQPSHAPAFNQGPNQGYNTGYAPAQASYNETSAGRQNKYKDPCVVPPSCLASFGFGGTVVTMFPKRKLRLNNAGSSFRNSPRMPMPSQFDNGPHGELRKGPVGVYRVEQIHPKDSVMEQLESFPGPLTENVTEATVLQYLESRLQQLSVSSGSLEEDEWLLLSILRILIKSNGKLRSDSSVSDPNSPEGQLVALLSDNDRRRRSNQPAAFPAPRPLQTGVHPNAIAQSANQIRDLLLVGNRKGAVEAAISAQMWPEAMLIASFTDKDEYKRVLCTYLNSHYAAGDPCRALYMSFADQHEKSVHEPQKLLQTHERHAERSSILSSWIAHAQVILANRTADTNTILIELGDRLWNETGSVLAAHICYLLAGITVEAPSPSSKIALLGGDHRTPSEARFYVSASAVQRTEIYEWIQKKANSNTNAMISFQGYKLIYAMILADHGKLETSFKYVHSMLNVIKAVTANMKPGTSMYLEGMQNQLTVLDDRLRQHLGQDRVQSVSTSSNGKQGKWGLGSALSIMGKIVNRVVEGSDAPATQSMPSHGAGSSLFQGAPRSNSGGHAPPAYPSGAASSYAPTQGQAPTNVAPGSHGSSSQNVYAENAYPVYSQQSSGPKSTNGSENGYPSYPQQQNANGQEHGYPSYSQQPQTNGSENGYPSYPQQPQQTPAPGSNGSYGGGYGGYGNSFRPSNTANAPHSNDRHAPAHAPAHYLAGHGQNAPPAPTYSGLPSAPAHNDYPPAPATPAAAPTPSQWASPAQQQPAVPPMPTPTPPSPSTFQKPTLDLSGDAGKSGLAQEKGKTEAASRGSEALPRSPKAGGDGPSSDKGSASPKFKDTKKTVRSKTPPPSGSKSSSGWFSGISKLITQKMNPDAKVAKLGEQMEAYFDEEKKRWVFPGETAAEEPVMPSAPPTGPMPGSTPNSTHGGPLGPPGSQSAPGSISGGAPASDDPLAALMAPPQSRAHASLMKKDPLSAMMAPPPRAGLYGQRAGSASTMRKPPRPQFAVFKPTAAQQAAPTEEPSE